jgi:hypothetical protein
LGERAGVRSVTRSAVPAGLLQQKLHWK